MHEITRARSAYRLRLVPVGFGQTLILDDDLHRHATIVGSAPPRLQTRQTGNDEALLCLLLFAHVVIDGLPIAASRRR